MKLFRGPIHDIDLDAPPDQRWAAFARAEGDAIQEMVQDIDDYTDAEILPHLPVVVQSTLRALASGSGYVARWLAAQFCGEYPAELKCIAQHADVPVGKLMLGNLIYDLTALSQVYGCGCSSGSLTVDGSPVLVRNMDWVAPPTTGKHTKLIRFRRKDKSYLSVGVAGLVGVVSALGDSWAMVINQAPVVKQVTGFWSGLTTLQQLFTAWPALQRVRAVCDRMVTYDELILGLRLQKTMSPFFAHVVGTKPKQHTVLEHAGDWSYVRANRSGMVQTNHYRHTAMKQYNPVNGDDWIWDTYERYDTLYAALHEDRGVIQAHARETPSAALKVLKDVTNEDTMQQMLLWPARSQMILKTAG